MGLFGAKLPHDEGNADGVLSPTRLVPLLAALFGIAFISVLLLRVESERHQAIDRARGNAAREAQILSSRVDAQMDAARASIDGGALLLSARSSTDAEMAVLIANRAQGLLATALLGPDGSVLASVGKADREIYADVLARVRASAGPTSPNGVPAWEGVIRGHPVLVRHLNDDTTLLSVLDPEKVLPTPSDDRRLIVADADGSIIAMVPAFVNPTEAPAFAAFGQAAPEPNALPGGLFGTNPDGQKSIVGYAKARSGFWAYTERNTLSFDKAWFGTLLFYLSIIGGATAATLAFCAIVVSQTNRFKVARDALKDAEQRFRIAIEGARCGIWDWHLGDDAVFLSEATANLLRLPNEGDCSGTAFLARLAPDDAQRLRAALSRSARGDLLDITVRAGNQSDPRWLQLRGRAAVDRGDPSTLRIIGVCLDVTEAQMSDQKILKAERTLRDAIGSLSGPFALFDRTGGLVLWNGAYADTFNLEPQILQAGNKYSVVANSIGQAIASAKTDTADKQLREIELLDGGWLNLVERRTTDGGLVSIGVDITAIKRQEEKLVSSERQLRALVTELGRAEQAAAELADKYAIEKARAEEASIAKSGFLANMSHELRTPLNAINGFSEVMERRIFGPLGHPKYEEYVRDIHASGQHLLEMINDVLDMAKVEAGRFTIHPRPIDPLEIVEQAVRLIHGRAEEKNLQLKVEAAHLPDIVADQRALKQMLINLLANAVKFTPAGGAIVVRALHQGDDVVIAVSDTGIGIPAEHLPRLARPFEQVENEHAKAHAGSGLGLALTKSLADMHGGRMEIDSEVGKGTTVTIYLPLVAKEQDDFDIPNRTQAA